MISVRLNGGPKHGEQYILPARSWLFVYGDPHNHDGIEAVCLRKGRYSFRGTVSDCQTTGQVTFFWDGWFAEHSAISEAPR